MKPIFDIRVLSKRERKARAARVAAAAASKALPVKAKPVKALPVKAKPVKAKPVKAKPVKANSWKQGLTEKQISKTQDKVQKALAKQKAERIQEILNRYQPKSTGVREDENTDAAIHIPAPRAAVQEKGVGGSFSPIEWWKHHFDFAVKHKDGTWTPTNNEKRATHRLLAGKENRNEQFKKDVKGRWISRPAKDLFPILSCAAVPIQEKGSNPIQEGIGMYHAKRRIPKALFGYKTSADMASKKFLLRKIVQRTAENRAEKIKWKKWIRKCTEHAALNSLFEAIVRASRNLSIALRKKKESSPAWQKFQEAKRLWKEGKHPKQIAAREEAARLEKLRLKPSNGIRLTF